MIPTLDWVAPLLPFLSPYAVLVASLVVSPTRLGSPISLARPVRVRLAKREVRGNNAHKETDAKAPVSKFVLPTT